MNALLTKLQLEHTNFMVERMHVRFDSLAAARLPHNRTVRFAFQYHDHLTHVSAGTPINKAVQNSGASCSYPRPNFIVEYISKARLNCSGETLEDAVVVVSENNSATAPTTLSSSDGASLKKRLRRGTEYMHWIMVFR